MTRHETVIVQEAPQPFSEKRSTVYYVDSADEFKKERRILLAIAETTFLPLYEECLIDEASLSDQERRILKKYKDQDLTEVILRREADKEKLNIGKETDILVQSLWEKNKGNRFVDVENIVALRLDKMRQERNPEANFVFDN